MYMIKKSKVMQLMFFK